MEKAAFITSDNPVKSDRKLGRLTVEELDVVQEEILRRVQRTTFPDELKTLSITKQDSKSNKSFMRRTGMSIRQLNPVLVSGLLKSWWQTCQRSNQ